MKFGSHVEKGPLSKADKVVKRLAKGWMHLPQRASPEVVFLPPNMGSGGLLPLADMADLYTIAHAFKLLSSRDAAVSGLALASLECVAAKRLGRAAAEQNLADYLSGVVDGDFACPSAGTASLWSHARNAARRASAALGLRWVWCAERRELGVECSGPSGNTITVTPQARSQVVRRLRSALVAHYRERLLAKKDQGKVYEVTSRSRVGNHFMRSGSFTRFAEWRFIHRARLDVLPLNATKCWQTGGDKRCRKCGAHLETLPHVIQHCRSNYVAITKRHDGVMDRLVKALKIPGIVSVNRTVDGVDLEWAQLRPDLVVRDEARKKIVIVDVAVPFENRSVALEEVRSQKLAKYQGLAACLERQGYDVKLMPFLVGALGGWDAGNERVIRLLGINRRYAVMMRRLMISDTIRWSRNVYVEHVSGARQY
ncbi:unnamed protein product [Trichogramma brassicae]|uniref:Reverse transcriptase zinc-binding domain-containing protein n=1 Tax=Trichogramma brassicae TaxID=86971 RepID=A0A6H5HYY8_9HYME|nr:unnamed protein product [Trichogramma brassicae]